MSTFRWIALAAVTLLCVLLSHAGLPPRRPLVPAAGLSAHVTQAVLARDPERLLAGLRQTALVEGLTDFDPTAAAAQLSPEARVAELPPLEPPVRLPAGQVEELATALAWLHPTELAVVEIEVDGRIETWLGVEGGRARVAGTVAGWFSPRLRAGDAAWLRIGSRPAAHEPATGRPAAAWDWPRPRAADVALIRPFGWSLQSGPPVSSGTPTPSGSAASPVAAAAGSKTAPVEDSADDPAASFAAALDAAGLPRSCTRFEARLAIDQGRLRCWGEWQGAASLEPPAGRPGYNPPAQAQLPGRAARDVFLTLQADIDWPRLYFGLLGAMTPDERADFERSMRFYRMAESGYKHPEQDLIDPLGRGFAVVGRRGARYGGVELLPTLQAELPLKPEPPGLVDPLNGSPNERFRTMMPDFVEARFDKIRRVGAPGSFEVQPSYVAVTVGEGADRYVLMRPTIAGSALIPAWEVNTERVKIGTRPEVLDEPDLLRCAGTRTGSRTGSPTGLHGGGLTGSAGEPSVERVGAVAPLVLSLYFDPEAITDQLDKFRILVKVEAGADRSKPDDGLTVERIEAENRRVEALTRANMQLAAHLGWVLQRIGPVTLSVRRSGGRAAAAEAAPAAAAETVPGAAAAAALADKTESAEFSGMVELKLR
ncbi:MAG: hypothetical protein ACREJ2_18020 [Planctomycetota bacterium]